MGNILKSDRIEVYSKFRKKYLGNCKNLFKIGKIYTAEETLSIGENPLRGYSMFDCTDNNPFGKFVTLPKNTKFKIIEFTESNLLGCTGVKIEVISSMALTEII